MKAIATLSGDLFFRVDFHSHITDNVAEILNLLLEKTHLEPLSLSPCSSSCLETFPDEYLHQSFVTTAPPPPHTPTGNSGDNDFSSITALLKALYCGDLLRVINLLFIRVNSTGYIYVISRHLPGSAGELKRSLPRTLAPLSPGHPRRWGGQGLQMTGALSLTKDDNII